MARRSRAPDSPLSTASRQLAALFADARASSGLTQQDLAVRAGVSLSAVRNLEKWRSPEPGFFLVSRLATVLVAQFEIDSSAVATTFRKSLSELTFGDVRGGRASVLRRASELPTDSTGSD